MDNTEPNYLSIWITAIERMLNDSDEILFEFVQGAAQTQDDVLLIERMEAV